MISLEKISDTEYYTGPDFDETPSLDLKPRQQKKRKHKDLDASNTEIEKIGSWQILARDSDWKNGQGTIFSSVADSDNVDPRVLQSLFNGRHPETSETLLGKRVNGGRGGAVDIQMSVPKSFSILMALAPRESGVRDTLKTIMRDAHRKALTFAFRAGWFVTRRADRFEPIAGCAVARFQHYTSRADDMNGHSHNVALKTALRSDGALCQIEPYMLKVHLGALAAISRSYEIAMLRQAGFQTEPRGRNYEICGVPQDLCTAFSKRRVQIEDVMKGLGQNSAESRAAAQLVAFQTRPKKSSRTESQLRLTWESTLREAGWSPDALLASARGSAAERDLETEPCLAWVVLDALESLTEHDAVFNRPKLLRAVFEKTQHFGFDPDEVVSCLEQHVVTVAAHGQVPVYTTPGMQRAEETLLKMALDSSVQLKTGNLGPDMPATGSDPHDKVTLTKEQETAVEWVTKSDDQMVIVSGRAGVGKSTAMRAARQIFEAEGRRVWGTAVSWQATNALRETLNLPRLQCFATAALLAEIRKGTLTLAPGDVVLLDEAGMLGTQDFLDLLTECRNTKVKLVALGDENQLKPVAAGAPFQLLQRALPLKRIDTIQRQSTAEMRFATTMLSRGNVYRGLEYYDEEGAIDWCKTADDAIHRGVAAYVKHRLMRPNETRVLLVDWNRDARRVNEAVRDSLRAAGEIDKSDAYIDALARGGDKSTVIRLPISAGDTLIFGETLKIQGVTIRNGDLVTVTAIDMSASQPVFTIALRDGQTFQATADDMIGTRASDDKRPRLPMLQHGYALTAHAAQGLTVDACYDVSLRQRGVESTYVCGSRHRYTYRKFVNLERVERDARRDLENRGGAALSRTTTYTKDALKEAYYWQSSRGDRVNNALDFLTRDELLEIADDKSLGAERKAGAIPEETSRVATLADRIAQLKTNHPTAKQRAHALRRRISADRSRHREIAHRCNQLRQLGDGEIKLAAPGHTFCVPDWTKPLPVTGRNTEATRKGKALWDQIFMPSSSSAMSTGRDRLSVNRQTRDPLRQAGSLDMAKATRGALTPSQIAPVMSTKAKEDPYMAKPGAQHSLALKSDQRLQNAAAEVTAYTVERPNPVKPKAVTSAPVKKKMLSAAPQRASSPKAAKRTQADIRLSPTEPFMSAKIQDSGKNAEPNAQRTVSGMINRRPRTAAENRLQVEVTAHASQRLAPNKPVAIPSTPVEKPGAKEMLQVTFQEGTSPKPAKDTQKDHWPAPNEPIATAKVKDSAQALETSAHRDPTQKAEHRPQTPTVNHTLDNKKSRDTESRVSLGRRVVDLFTSVFRSNKTPMAAPAPDPNSLLVKPAQQDNDWMAKQKRVKPGTTKEIEREQGTRPDKDNASHTPPRIVIIDLRETVKTASKNIDIVTVKNTDEIDHLDLTRVCRFLILSPEHVSAELAHTQTVCARIAAEQKRHIKIETLPVAHAAPLTPRVVEFDCRHGRTGYQLHGDVLRVQKGSGADVFPSGLNPCKLEHVEIIGDESDRFTLRRMKIVEQDLKLFQSRGLLGETVRISRSKHPMEVEKNVAQNMAADPAWVEMDEIPTGHDVEPAEPDEPSIGM